MTPTIETGAALPAFQPGDRVLVEMLFHSVHFERASIQFMPEGMPFCVNWDRIHPLPTEAETVRRVKALVVREHGSDMGLGHQLEGFARMLERMAATSAPKPPPTLRDLAEKAAEQFEFYEQQHRAKGTPDADAKAEVNRALAAEMREALAREVQS